MRARRPLCTLRLDVTRLEVIGCEHGERCGGCDHLGVPYGEQLEGKRARLVEALRPYPTLRDLAPGSTRGAASPSGYRTRLKWMAGPGGALGLFARGGHEVVDTPACAVAAPGLAAIGVSLRALLRDPLHARIAASLRAIDLREVAGADGGAGALLTLVLVREERPPRHVIDALATALRDVQPRIAGVAVNWVAKHSIQVLGPETETVAGAASALDQQGDVAVTAIPGGFVQAHRGQAAAMARALVLGVAPLGGRPRVLELFAGASPFGLALAKAGCDVTSVESFGPAVEGARAAAAAQDLVLRAIVGDAEGVTDDLARRGERFDVVVVDPPRRGLTPRLRAAIASLAARALAYVSCDPDTLARDLADMRWRGLAVRSIEPWDFVPLTEHVEALAWLVPGRPPALTVLARGDGEVLVDAPPHLDMGDMTARAGGREALSLSSPLPRGGSGAVLLRPRAAAGRAAVEGMTVVAAVRGLPRGELRGVPGVLMVRRRGPGRALVAIDLDRAGDAPRLADALLRAGHPVLGDPRDDATARHVWEKHGVDRPLLHVEALTVTGVGRVEAPLAADMFAALPRLGIG